MSGRNRYFFIVNPKAGKCSCLTEISDFVKELHRDGIHAEILYSQKRGDCENYAAKISEQAKELKQVSCIFACGGDGTLNEVVNGVLRNGINEWAYITHIPRGSGNDFIKSFSHPEMFRPADMFTRGIISRKIDVMRVNDRYCLNICSIGLDARICDGMNKYRKLPSGKMSYGASVAENLVKGRLSSPMRVCIGNNYDRAGDITMVCICNGSWYGGGYNPVPEASIQDGQLDVLIVNKVSPLKAATIVNAYKKGNYAEHPKIVQHYRTDESISVKPIKPEPVNVDGEIFWPDMVEINVLKGYINFFAPMEAW